MSFKKTVKDVKLEGKRVLLRADYNVPVKEGKITDDYRIKQSVLTIEYILQQKPASLTIISHLGRPEGPEKDLSLAPVAKHLSNLLGKKVHFAADCIGEQAKEAVLSLARGGILMLENLRFHGGEEKNDLEFAKRIVEAIGAEVFVQDGFGVVHRAHASTEAITRLLPSVAGLLLQKELETITKVMAGPAKPLVAIVGGAKIADKIEVLHKFIELADCVAIGGAMANNFLLEQGHKIGKSLFDKEDAELSRQLIAKAAAEAKKRPFSFLLPLDVVVSKSKEGKSTTRIVDLASHSLADIEAYPKIPKPRAYSVAADEMILDIGPISAGRIAGAIELAKTVIWNGTVGITEIKGIAGAHAPFAHATHMIVSAMIGPHNAHLNNAFSLVGGGDTVGYIESEGLIDDFNHVSTGGGAALELMAGKKLPGYEALTGKS